MFSPSATVNAARRASRAVSISRFDDGGESHSAS